MSAPAGAQQGKGEYMYIRNRLAALAAALLTLLTVSLPASADTGEAPADEIVLKNGSRILGTITGSRDGVVTVDTDFAGTVTIELAQVETLNSTATTTLLLADSTVVRDVPLQIDAGQLVAGGAQPRPLEELAVVNPEPWELGEGYKWTGLVNFAWLLERGNTDKDELDYKFETEWRSTHDRYRLSFKGEEDEANNVKTADNWLANAKWDYFLTDPNYWGMLAQAEKDKFADLDLRWLVGPYIGRQFLDTSLLSIAGEWGVSYVTEEFNVAEDQDYPATNWDINVSSAYLGGDSRLYVHQFGLWNLDETSDVVINTTLGLAFPLLFNFEAAAEILWEYDSGAVDGVDDMDETYAIRIGYTW